MDTFGGVIILLTAVLWNKDLCSLTIHILQLYPQCEGIGRWDFGEVIGSERLWIGAHIKETPECSLAPSAIEGLMYRWLSMKQEGSPCQTQKLLAP